jgi:GT2 family glycosyltransferase
MEHSVVAVAILNWNGRALLEKYLPGVVKHSAPHSIYVIDNYSSDDSLDFVRKKFPQVKIIQTGSNLGYAGGYNEGLKDIQEPYAVLLNSDVRTTPGWLNPIVDHFEEHPNCAALQPKILWDREPNRFEYAGASGGFIDSLGYPFCRGRILNELEADIGQYNEPRKVFWATGACLAVRTQVFKDLGGLDPMLFAHMEEIDLCWRMQRAGFEIWVQPESTVYHLGGATLNMDSPRKTFLNFRNNLSILVKNLPHGQAMKIVFVRLLLDGIAGIKFVLEGKPIHTWAIVKAHFAFYGRFSRIQRARASTAKYPFLPLHQLTGTFPGSLIWQFYIKGKKKFSDFY